MTVTDINTADALVWSQFTDQVNTDHVQNDGSDDALYSATDVTVETINGVTYIVTTWGDADVTLHKYTDDNGDGVYEATLLGRYEGGSAPDDDGIEGPGTAYYSPALEQQGDTLIITVGTEREQYHALTYDLTQPIPTNDAEAATTLDYRGDVLDQQVFRAGGDRGVLEKFTLSNGESYYIGIDNSGDMASYQLIYDEATDYLTFEENFWSDSTAFNNDYPYLGGKLIRTDTLDQNSVNIIVSGAADTDFVQVGDVIYGYSVGTYGLETTKWELDSNGNMTGAQVVYTDGTTTKDLYELYLSDPVTYPYDIVDNYPATSPFDGTSPTLATAATNAGFSEINYLQSVSGVTQQADLADGSRNVIDLEYMQNVGTFVIDDQIYMAVATWNGSEDGVAVFSVDPTTGAMRESW